MKQYDVYRLKHGDVVVILQHDTYGKFKTRVVAPLVSRAKGKLATSLNPVFKHGRREWVLATHLLNVVRLPELVERLGSLDDQNYAIKRAVDQLLLGV